MKKTILLLVLVAASWLSGCASVTGSTTQSVSVYAREPGSGEVQGATCELTNSKGKWFVTTPGSVMIHRSNDDMHVYCNKTGYEPGRASVVSETKAQMFGNILIGGVIGAVIDHNSGSGYEYPGIIHVLMRAMFMPDRARAPGEIRQHDVAGAVTPPAAKPEGATERAPSEANASPRDTRKSAARREGDPHPQVGDTWTYRYSNGFGRSGNYTVRIKAASAEEVSDEVQVGWRKDVSIFSPGLALTNRKVGDLLLREVSPYLLSLGPVDATPEWSNVAILPGDEPLRARHVGTEVVEVQAGRFEASKVVIEGRDLFRNAYAGLLTRPYTVTVWYAPSAKRFVKLAFTAPGGGAFTQENEVVELVETNFSMRTAGN